MLPLGSAAAVDVRVVEVNGRFGSGTFLNDAEIILVIVIVVVVARRRRRRLGRRARGFLLEPRRALRGRGSLRLGLPRLLERPGVLRVAVAVAFVVFVLRVARVFVAHGPLGDDPHARRGDGLDGVRREPVRLGNRRVARGLGAATAAPSSPTPGSSSPSAGPPPAAPTASRRPERSLLGERRVRRFLLLGDGGGDLDVPGTECAVPSGLDHRRR